MSEKPEDLAKIYSSRFLGSEAYRYRVWEILIHEFLRKWICPDCLILDLGCGHGEFINQVAGKRKWGMDLNPETATRLSPEVVFLRQNCAEPWNLPEASLDLVFTSNFFEHLFDKEALHRTLQQAHRALKPGGRLVALGPNIRLLPGAYWDFWDHYLPLTERSLAEAGKLCGFTIEEAVAATLPYSMSQGFQPPLWTLRLYLALPFLWRFFGKQFLVVMRK
jgi:SAM-dependent methyltransferase